MDVDHPHFVLHLSPASSICSESIIPFPAAVWALIELQGLFLGVAGGLLVMGMMMMMKMKMKMKKKMKTTTMMV